METEFVSDDLDKLETDENFTGGYAREIVKAFRKRMQAIRAAADERDLIAVRGNRFEKLKGGRSHQHSLRINDQMRLVVEIVSASPKNKIRIVAIEDYH